MNIEHHQDGVKIDGPAIVIRKNSGIRLFTNTSGILETSARETCPKCGKSGFNCCSYSDSVDLSKEGKSLSKNSDEVHKDENKNSATVENNSGEKTTGNKKLSEEEKQEVDELKVRDREVRQHEQAHQAAAGHLASGGPSFTYEEGPDGNRYATGGEVNIKLDKGSTPEEKLNNAQQAERAANAPAEPSSQDRQVAAEARQMANEAREEIQNKREEESSQTGTESTVNENKEISPLKKAANSYLSNSIESKQSEFDGPSTSRSLKMGQYYGGLSVYA